MNTEQLKHLLRAASANTGEKTFIVIGSQAILATHPDAPRSLRKSMEGDTWPKYSPEKAIVIDSNIGEGSLFHQTHGYYAHGVSPETPTLPPGWESRLVSITANVETPEKEKDRIVGLCLEKHDLAFSKLAAGREKDTEYIVELLMQGLINRGKIQKLIDGEPQIDLQRKLQRNWTIVLAKLTKRKARPMEHGPTGNIV